MFFSIFFGFFLKPVSPFKTIILGNKNRKIDYNDFASKWNYEKRYPMYKWVSEKENLIIEPCKLS